ncbi:hypothetical protein [Deinococcus sonorensis]|uniref:Uncharacterized protein n=2 Tax=Deinococcus sonorensis TaxID=309891 RepID=A0AAU7UG32_9DEIO
MTFSSIASSTVALPLTTDRPQETSITDHWEQLLSERDRERLAQLQQAGVDVRWRQKTLTSDEGRVIVHHFVEAQARSARRPLGVAGPADFRHGRQELLVQRMVRSVLGQALTKLQAS